MEKLIKLLNNYELKVVKKSYMYPVYHYDEDKNIILNLYIGFNTEDDIKYQWLLSYIISRSYGFIKRLVENDKIDLEDQAMQYAKSDLSKFFAEWKDKNGMSDDYAMLLMLLAIQDEPIEFLISILK